MNISLISLLILFILISAALVALIVRLLRKEAAQKALQVDQNNAVEQQSQDQRTYLVESIKIIARSIVARQCPQSEGCLRIKVLIDNLAPQLHHDPDLKVIEQVYQAIEHIPTLSQWKALSAQEKQQHRQTLAQVEQEHTNAIMLAAAKLVDYPYERLVH